MTEVAPSPAQIGAEWTVTDPVGDSARWREGISRYEAVSLDDSTAMEKAAELMCAALTYYVADGTVICELGGEPPDTLLTQTIWNVLVATLYSRAGTPPTAGSAKCLRLALAAARQGGFQPADLGGNDLMAELFEDTSRAQMSAALSDSPAHAGDAPVELAQWFTGQAGTRPVPAAGSRWGAWRERAQQARHHVNPLALQHGIEAIQGALTGSQIAKTDRAGRLKIRKFGLAKAAVRPSKTLRRALDGAALTEHLKAYNHQVYGVDGSPPDSDE